jgi:hypothetical protein
MRGVVFLFLSCLFFYILFTRQPDYWDGEFSPAIIVSVKDSASKQSVLMAQYYHGTQRYLAPADYPFARYKPNQRLTVIYETNNPSKGAIYRVWGYWLQWGELLFSVVGIILLYQVAVAITQNPTPEALLEQLEPPKVGRKPKYDA